MSETKRQKLASLGIVLIGLLALTVPSSLADELNPALALSASAVLGIVSSTWHFQGVNDVRLSAPRAFGLAVGYGPVRSAYDTRLSVSVEGVAFTKGTREAELQYYPFGTAELRINSAAGLVYISLSAPNRLSPFVRFGLGGARVEFEETYSAPGLEDILIHYWAVAYGLGAGINYTIVPWIGVSVFYEGMYIPGDRRGRRSDGVETGIRNWWGSEWTGIRLHIGF
jgi:opacity protein-like surface antigen